MEPMQKRSARMKFTIAVLVMLLGLGCLCIPVGINPSSWGPGGATSTTAPAEVTATAYLPPTTAAPNPHLSISPDLNASGPWLLIDTAQGLWATNSDGSGLSQFTDADYWNYDPTTSIQPGGHLVAFISPADYDFHHNSLNLLSLPDGKITKITDLTSPQTETYADLMPGDNGFEGLRAMREQQSLAWSPDGKLLAFVGLMDGPSADIYTYDVVTGTIQRISQDPDQEYWPSWSPDGSTLMFFSTQAFGTGAGFNTTGVWAASGPGMTVKALYYPQGGNEEMNGWLDNTTAVLDTWTPQSGSGNLRLYDVVTGTKSVLSSDAINGAAAESGNQTVIFDDSSGLYLLTADNRTPTLLRKDPITRILPLEPGDAYFTVALPDGSLATYGVDPVAYQVSPIATSSGNLAVTMYGIIWGWTSSDASQPGAWITGPGVEIGQIYKSSAILPAWDQHNNLLFFSPQESGDYELYRITFDSHYTDLTMVNTLNAEVRAVNWLGNQ
jgi:hypothetical protein